MGDRYLHPITETYRLAPVRSGGEIVAFGDINGLLDTPRKRYSSGMKALDPFYTLRHLGAVRVFP